MNKKVHIVPHMHWDREWYFSTEESRILLVNNMEEILDMLENNEDYPCYVLDGQTAILEDYFQVKPENKERVKRLVQAGKLIIGPWYTQTDEMIVGGESIVRNLLYGLKDCEAFGEPMKIGYLPDSFGQSAQLPQILNGFDINRAIFWRGTSERHGTNKTEFYWESDTGAKVLTQLFPLGYAIGKYLPVDEEQLRARMDKYFSVLDRGATTEHMIIPNGHDQMPIQKNIFEVIEKLKEMYPERDFFLSRYEKIFEQLETNEALPVLKGEFLDGKYMRVHRSIYSTRMDIKGTNARIENKITNILEPLATLAYSLGFEYHSGLMELIWKEMMKNHAHDSIGCCCSDKVHQEIMGRFFIAEEKVDQLINFYMRKIADAIPTDIELDKLVLFNLLPYEREVITETEVITKMKKFELVDINGHKVDFDVVNKEIIDPGLIDRQIVHYGNYDPFIKYTLQLKDRLPAMGYKSYLIKNIKDDSKLMVKTIRKVEEIETNYYKISVNENGSIQLYDKQLGQLFDQVLILEDGADDGDEYDYSPLEDDFIVYSDNVKANYEMGQNDYFAYVTINYTLDIPKDLESRKGKVCDSTMDVNIELKVPVNSPIIDVRMNINNNAKDHRLRALIPTKIKSSFSISDNQFGSIQRPVIDPAIEVWEKEQWDERPDAIYPMLSYVGLSNDTYGLAVLSNSTREFEIVGEDFDTIGLTLFRSVGVLGKEELLRRPGRPSGIKLETPDSQMLGNIDLHFALTIHKKSTLKANVARVAKEFLTPVYTYNKMPHNAMKLNSSERQLPYEYSLFEQKDRDTVLSVLKKAEKNEGLIIRYFNATDTEKITEYTFNREIKSLNKVNLNEEVQEVLDLENTSDIRQRIKQNEVQTVLVKL